MRIIFFKSHAVRYSPLAGEVLHPENLFQLGVVKKDMSLKLLVSVTFCYPSQIIFFINQYPDIINTIRKL
ncbi:MAG TPA: hypothetical protein VI548_09545 [Chitinophagaceae bacterium]|nr:hypothetical protein [Chitinophagaceae bacterium]